MRTLNAKKSKNMEKERVQPHEIGKRRSVVLNNDKEIETRDNRLVQLQKIRKYEQRAPYNEEKSKNVDNGNG